MKLVKYITLLLVLVSTNLINAQNYNPQVLNGEADVYLNGIDGKVSFDFTMEKTGYNFEEGKSLSFTLCLLNAVPTGEIDAISGFGKDYFTWRYDETMNCFLATQKEDLGGESELLDFECSIKATSYVSCETMSKIGFNVNIQPSGCMNATNLTIDDHLSEYSCHLTTANKELFAEVLSVYPNPCSNYIEISTNYSDDSFVTIYDESGKLVFSRVLSKITSPLEVKDWSVGVYLIKISDNQKKVTLKFVKI